MALSHPQVEHARTVVGIDRMDEERHTRRSFANEHSTDTRRGPSLDVSQDMKVLVLFSTMMYPPLSRNMKWRPSFVGGVMPALLMASMMIPGDCLISSSICLAWRNSLLLALACWLDTPDNMTPPDAA